MSNKRPASWHEPDISGLPPDSYTAFRLQHATPEHLHQTSRRFFIGPIPEGWLKTHRRDWYKQLPTTIETPSRPTPYSSDPRQARQRQLSGLDGPSVSAMFLQSFPQPEDLSDEDEEGNEQDQDKGDVSSGRQDQISAKSLPRSAERNNGALSPQNTGGSPSDQDTIGSKPVPVADPKPGITRRPTEQSVSSPTSFVTASSFPESVHEPASGAQVREQASNLKVPSQEEEGEGEAVQEQNSLNQNITTVESSNGAASMTRNASVEANSTTSLLRNANSREPQAEAPVQPPPKGILSKMKRKSQGDIEVSRTQTTGTLSRTKSHIKQFVKFDIPEDSRRAELHLKAKAAQMKVQRASSKLRRPKVKDGLVVKMERMLVRVDAAGKEVPEDFDENGNQKIDSRVRDKWREYMVVCRQCVSEGADFVLQMYKTRVIPEIEKANMNKRAAYEIPLGRKVARVNLYSSLDKSVVVWTPYSRGTRIFIMQARTASNAVEWYTFMRNILGWRRAAELEINVPDLKIHLRIQNPFRKLEASQSIAANEEPENAQDAVIQTMKEEQVVTQNIIRRCVEMLHDTDEWRSVLETWLKSQRIGLAWKRYDRLEWVHGANERRMYGTVGMLRSHDLELRPKTHYPTTAVTRKKQKTLTEPKPVEGFLIRLTSQRGTTRRLGLLYHKQLYFSTHDNYLIFSRPAKAIPPPPPNFPDSDDATVPEATVIAQKLPDTWVVDPYPLANDEIEWLSAGGLDTPEAKKVRDTLAKEEADRKAQNLLHCDGYINLCNVAKVRKARKGAIPAVDDNIDSGSDVDFDEDVDDETTRDDGVTSDFDVERSLEIIMNNGLIMRLQAADKDRRKDWVKHLRHLVKYWKLRKASDIGLLISTRAQNLEALNIDEEGEAAIGQYAKKWEVSHTYASPDLYNICGIATCRSIHMSGTLYRKPRIHAPFTRCGVILTAGTLVIFRDVLRSNTGKLLRHVHHEHISNLDLKDCYIYSGLLTEPDLLYQNQTFDSNKPGHHALPRIYLDDGWTSTDEDVMTTFVVWHGKSKSWFRAEEAGASEGEESSGNNRKKGERGVNEGRRTKLKRVAKLGSTGRSVVFRARSRAERDHWVLAIQNEIERVNGGVGEDFRIEEVEGIAEGSGSGEERG